MISKIEQAIDIFAGHFWQQNKHHREMLMKKSQASQRSYESNQNLGSGNGIVFFSQVLCLTLRCLAAGNALKCDLLITKNPA